MPISGFEDRALEGDEPDNAVPMADEMNLDYHHETRLVLEICLGRLSSKLGQWESNVWPASIFRCDSEIVLALMNKSLHQFPLKLNTPSKASASFRNSEKNP